MTQVAERSDTYLSSFEMLEGDLPGARSPWLKALRRAALARFSELGFPDDKNEDWRFTRVDPIASTSFLAAPRDPSALGDVSRVALCALKSQRLVFVDGRYAPSLSSLCAQDGVSVRSLGEVLETEPAKVEPHLARLAGPRGQAFAALNTAFFTDGAFVHLAKGSAPELPIHLLFVSTSPLEATVSYPRVLIVAEQDCKASLIEEYAGDGSAYFTNAVTEIALGENARLEHYKLEREGEKAFHIAATEVRQERGSSYTSHSIALGGALVRHDLNVLLDAEGAECALNGLYWLKGRQHVDNHTRIDHAKPHTVSRELYKGVLDGHTRAVFNGTIIVRPDAQKISSIQANRNLVLSEEGLVNTKPEFKIYANDVQCKHGATIGQISPEALFYLRSRGIGEEAARQLLIYAFMSEMVQRITLAPLREAFVGLLTARLPESMNGR